MIYPDKFPQPTVEGFGLDLGMGVLRTAFESGVHRQRRQFYNMPTEVSLRFVIPVKQLREWTLWANSGAYTWFDGIRAASYINTPDEHCANHKLRFIGDIAMSPVGGEYMAVTVRAELVYQFYEPPSYDPGWTGADWVIAESPASPAVDWVVAGTPLHPNKDIIVPGTPAAPSVTI